MSSVVGESGGCDAAGDREVRGQYGVREKRVKRGEYMRYAGKGRSEARCMRGVVVCADYMCRKGEYMRREGKYMRSKIQYMRSKHNIREMHTIYAL